MPLANNPLTDEHCACLDRALAMIPRAEELAQACLTCGWDVSDFIAKLSELRKMATTAKAQFFPDRP